VKKWFKEKILSNNKNTMLFIGIACFFVLFVYQIVMLCCGTYLNSNSDDVVQYAPILNQYINYFKEGNLGWFNFTNNLGASVFADVYYVPLDIFTLITFLLSFIMNDFIAFSITNLIKVLLGVIVFAWFLQRKEFKNSTILILSLMYFSVGGSWVLFTYPTYFSLFFYLPLSLIVIDYYVKGKKWLLPLYGFALILYNFYNAYTLFIFMVLVYIVVQIRDSYAGFKKLVKDVVVFGLHILLSVILGMFILLPSVLYILNFSVRNGGSFEFIFDFTVYFKMLYRLFVYEAGTTTFALNGDYVHMQFSYYVGVMGLFMLGLLFLMKDRTSKIYKWTIISFIIMMVIPVISMLFSGVLTPYTRWFSFINIILIYYIGYVIDKVDFKEIDKKNILKLIIGIGALYVITFIFNIIVINGYKEVDYVKYYNYIQSIVVLILFGVLLLLYIIFYLVKKWDLLYGVFLLEMVVAIIINFSVSFKSDKLELLEVYNESNDILDKVSIDDELIRIYMNNEIRYIMNSNRITNKFTSESTFHSFMTKYIYNYQLLSRDKNIVLYTEDLNRFNPYNSRVMDYKYIVVDKELYDYELDYLDVYYEDDKYLIYVNDRYESFYVYESYYDEMQVVSFSDSHNLLYFERMLFDGVILDQKDLNLDKLEYGNDINSYNKNSVVKQADIVKVVDGVYELDVSDYSRFGYEGTIYFRSEDIKNIISISSISGDNILKCNLVSSIYKCDFSDSVDKVLIETEKDIQDLEYVVEVEEEDEFFTLLLLEDNELNSRYLNFYADNIDIVLKKGSESRICMSGLCRVDDFDFDHVLYKKSNLIYSDKEVYLDYYYDNLENYLNTSNDNLAKDKVLTYEGSTINVRYNRVSNSSNDQVVVLPVVYSEEWVCENSDYELVRANGGYLGVVVKNGVEDVNLSITFKPSGVKSGLIISLVGFGIYGLYIGLILYKKKKEKEIRVDR